MPEDAKITGRIVKAVGGFWYADCGKAVLRCRARGRFRLDNISPLVGDLALVADFGGGEGSIEEILPRKNHFLRPAVANIELMVIVAAAALPVTVPFLIDRMAAIAELKGCEPVVCFNKCDMARADALRELYERAGFTAIHTSAVTGEGLERLREAMAGKLCAFAGNSGVGKSSMLNFLRPGLDLPTDEVSLKLGRGKHTTRHVELFRLDNGALVADTPGFASFSEEDIDLKLKERLPFLFRDFGPYLERCRFSDCAHVSDVGCAVLEALKEGKIAASRHESYVRLREQAGKLKAWEI